MWEAWRTFTVRLPAPTEREWRYPGDTIGATTSMLNTQTRFERLAYSGYGQPRLVQLAQCPMISDNASNR